MTKKSKYAAKDLSHERLLTLVDYDAATGAFTHKLARQGVIVGKRADYVEHNGYRYLTLDGNRHLAAQLAWFYVKGSWPERMIRFQDGNKGNCAVENLAYGEWDQSTPEGKRAYDKSHRKVNPMSYRKHDLKRDFGISLEQYQDALVAQDGVCAVCKSHENDARDGKRKWLAVDHDHSDHTFRGLLCTSCNNMLGRAKDSIETLRAAITYLEAHASKPKTNVIPLSGRRISGTKGN